MQRPRGRNVQACVQGAGQWAWSRVSERKAEGGREGQLPRRRPADHCKGCVSASEEAGSHGGCDAEEGYSMAFSLAAPLPAACGGWIAGGWGAGKTDWEAGAVIQAAASGLPSKLCGRLLRTWSPNPPCTPAQAVFTQKALPAPPRERPRLAERDIQKPPTLQLLIRWILLPDRVREIRSLLLPRPNYSVSGCNVRCKRNTSSLQSGANCSLLPPFCQKHSICPK